MTQAQVCNFVLFVWMILATLQITHASNKCDIEVVPLQAMDLPHQLNSNTNSNNNNDNDNTMLQMPLDKVRQFLDRSWRATTLALTDDSGTTKPALFTTLSAASLGSVLCSDYRTNEPSVGIEGGDVGIFAIAMQTVQDLRPGNVPLSQSEIDVALSVYIDKYKNKLALCMSDSALQRLCRSIGFCSRGPELASPPGDVITTLENALVAPPHVGDDVLRYVLATPSLFPALDASLVQKCIRSFFRLLWNRSTLPLNPMDHARIASKLDLVILPQPATPRVDLGMIEIHAAAICTTPEAIQDTPVLAVTPSQLSVRVTYPDVVQSLASLLSRFIDNTQMVPPQVDIPDVESSAVMRCVSGGASNSSQVHEGDVCVFPFTAEGHVFTTCAPSPKYEFGWCAVRGADWELEDMWGPCAALDVPCHDKGTSASTRQDRISRQILTRYASIRQEVHRQFKIDQIGGSDSRMYPVVSAKFPSLACCPAPSYTLAMQQIAFKLPPPPKPVKQSFLCSPASISIVPDPSAERAQLSFDSVSPPQIQQLLGLSQMEPVSFAVLKSATLLPMDGRISEKGLTTPGGVVAEYAASLCAVEGAVPGGLTEFDVTALLVGFAAEMSMPMFTYILDSQTISRVVGSLEYIDRQELTQIQRLPDAPRNKAMMDLLTACPPSPEAAKDLLEALSSPASISDLFLSFVLEFKSAPHTAPETARILERFQSFIPMVIRAFFRILWNIPVRWLPTDNSEMLHLDPAALYLAQSRMDLVALEGLHEESGVVRVQQASPKCKRSFAPRFIPSTLMSDTAAVSLWLYQEDSPRMFREETVSYLRKRVGASQSLSLGGVTGRISDLIAFFARQFFNSPTLSNIPVYTATLDTSCCPHSPVIVPLDKQQ